MHCHLLREFAGRRDRDLVRGLYCAGLLIDVVEPAGAVQQHHPAHLRSGRNNVRISLEGQAGITWPDSYRLCPDRGLVGRHVRLRASAVLGGTTARQDARVPQDWTCACWPKHDHGCLAGELTRSGYAAAVDSAL